MAFNPPYRSIQRATDTISSADVTEDTPFTAVVQAKAHELNALYQHINPAVRLRTELTSTTNVRATRKAGSGGVDYLYGLTLVEYF